jgi:radical SAM protein with 4Fe4S-binding SPASM domain
MKTQRDFSEYRQAVQNRAVELPYNPPVIFLESVRGCPHSCAMCHFRGTKIEKMQTSLLDKLEPYFRELEVLAVHGQGEPLLGDMEYFVEESEKNHFVLHMNTSGFLLTKRLSDLLSKTRLSIRFSIHAGTQETYRRIMGHDLRKVKENVSYLVNRANDSHHDCDFWFSFLVMKENIDEIEDFLLIAHDCGIKSVRFMRPIPNWQSLRAARAPGRDFRFAYFEQYNKTVHDRFTRSLPRYKALSDKLGIKIEAGSLSAGPRSNHRPILETVNNVILKLFGNKLFPLAKMPGFCLAPWLGQLVIDLNGNVRLCCSTTYSLGNLNDSSLAEIWNSPKMKAIRASFARGYNPKACSYCKGFKFANYPNNSFVERDPDI